jgi:replication initiator protein
MSVARKREHLRVARIRLAYHAPDMSLTLEQRTNFEGVPKAAELIEITGAHALEASDRAILNLLYQHAHDSGRLTKAGAEWEMPISSLRFSKHYGTERIPDSLGRLLDVRVCVTYLDQESGQMRDLMTHLFDFFDVPSGGKPGPVRYGVPDKLRPILAQSSRWGRIKAELVCAMSSKYAMALYELVQLRGNLDRSIERFAVKRFRELVGVPPGTYERGNDLLRYVINPAVVEVNGLSEYGVRIDPERAHARAPITAVMLGWWRKDEDEATETYQERQRSKQGRMARLKGVGPDEAPAPLFARLAD